MTVLKPVPLVLKHEDWPETDRAAWDALFVLGRLFDDEGPCVNWSAGTRRLRKQGYGQWLSFIKRTESESLVLAPAARITRSRIEAYIVESRARLKLRSVFNLVLSLTILASKFAPRDDWSWLWRAVTRLRLELGSGDLKPMPSIAASDIFRWSLRRIGEVDADLALTDVQRAIGFRWALLIGILISCPVRRRAFLAMTVTGHVIESGGGFQLRFAAADMKDKKARKFPLPRQLTGAMQLYLAFYRPILLGSKQSDGLWLSHLGEPLTEDGFSRAMPDFTELHLGVALRPHAFRHIVATSIAETDPVHVGIIRDVLGHATLDMADKHYNHATANAGCSRLQSIIRDIRQKSRKMKELGK